MVQTVNAKNLLDKNLMMYCLLLIPQYIQSRVKIGAILLLSMEEN